MNSKNGNKKDDNEKIKIISMPKNFEEEKNNNLSNQDKENIIEKNESKSNDRENEKTENNKNNDIVKKNENKDDKINDENNDLNILNNNDNKKDEKKNKTEDKGPIKSNFKKEVPISEWGCRTIDEYDIVNNKPVGDGSYGTVFKAYYKGSKEYGEKYGIPEIVALKKIKTTNEKEGFPITALREIMIMKRLRHKNILQLLEVVTSKLSERNKNKQNAYLVFEYMEHDLCSILLSNFVYEKSQIKFILYQLLLGIQYLHNNNILHRDIKTLNILLNNKGEVKIGDFGLSRIFTQNLKRKYTNRVVTICYRSPELLLGENIYGPEIDIWSLGCVFWEILTGNCIFYGDNEKSVFLRICQILGNPNEANWPGVEEMPYYKNLIPQKKYDNILNKEYKRFPNIDETTFDLVKKMLCLNPKERITIEEALNHPYFISHEPKMCEQKDMPKIEEELHYYTFKLKKEQMKQQQQQNIAKGEYDKKNKSYLGKKRGYN
jgi:cyclin-dependent kinase 12/13